MWQRLTALVIGIAIVASACGDSGDVDDVASLSAVEPTGTTQSVEVDSEQQLFRFAACMREQGIDLPDPTVDFSGNLQLTPPEGFDASDTGALLEAAEACEEFLEGVTLGFENIDISSITDTLLVFAECMRANGYELPDPDFSLINPAAGPVPNAGPFGDVDFDDPDFTAAFGECDDLIANLGIPGPGGG